VGTGSWLKSEHRHHFPLLQPRKQLTLLNIRRKRTYDRGYARATLTHQEEGILRHNRFGYHMQCWFLARVLYSKAGSAEIADRPGFMGQDPDGVLLSARRFPNGLWHLLPRYALDEALSR
jgi:hypothetical protein